MMDVRNILLKAYELFLITGDGDNSIISIKRAIENGQYEKAIRQVLYKIIYDLNWSPAYNNVKKEEIADIIVVLTALEEKGLRDDFVIGEFGNIVARFFNYLIENKLEYITNEEKRYSIYEIIRELQALSNY